MNGSIVSTAGVSWWSKVEDTHLAGYSALHHLLTQAVLTCVMQAVLT